MQAGTESDDLDRHLLAEVLVILRDVGRIVEREIHHRRVVGIHLQNQVVLLLVGGGPLQYSRRGVLLLGHLRRRRRDDEQSQDAHGRSDSIFKLYHRAPPMIVRSPSVGWLGNGACHLHAAATFSRTTFSPPRKKCPSWAAPVRVERRTAMSPSSGSDCNKRTTSPVNAAPVPNEGEPAAN